MSASAPAAGAPAAGAPAAGATRVVSLTCSNTEILDALGLIGWLVGVDDASDHPAEALAGVPRVGPDLGVDVAAVAALRPDLVLASLSVPGHERVVDGLRAAGLPTLVLDPTHIDDVPADVRTVACALGVPERGDAVAASLMRQLAPRPARPGPRPTILVEWWPKPIIAPGRDSWVTQLIERAGGRNPLADDPCRSRPLTHEHAAALAPDAVVISWCGVPEHRYRTDVVTRRAGWQQVPAIARGRVVPISEAYLGRPGPRLAEGLRRLSGVVDAIHADRA